MGIDCIILYKIMQNFIYIVTKGNLIYGKHIFIIRIIQLFLFNIKK